MALLAFSANVECCKIKNFYISFSSCDATVHADIKCIRLLANYKCCNCVCGDSFNDDDDDDNDNDDDDDDSSSDPNHNNVM